MKLLIFILHLNLICLNFLKSLSFNIILKPNSIRVLAFESIPYKFDLYLLI